MSRKIHGKSPRQARKIFNKVKLEALAEAQKGNYAPGNAAITAADKDPPKPQETRQAIKQSIYTDAEAQEAYFKAQEARLLAENDKTRSLIWNSISGGLVALGMLLGAAGVLITLCATTIPILGPKAGMAVSGAGVSLATGGALLFSWGPHLNTLAITGGIALSLLLIAGAFIYANRVWLKSPQALTEVP